MQRFSSRWLSWALLAAMFKLAVFAPGVVAAQETVSDPVLGETVPYIGTEGDVLALLRVDQVVDPFRDYSRDGPPGRGFHFVLVSVTVENTGFQPFAFNSASVRLQDVDGFVYSSGYVTRTPESLAVAPDFPYGDIAPGEVMQGVVLYPVPNGARLTRVIYQPDFTRLVVLSDLRSGAPGGLEAPAPPAGIAPPAPPAPPADAITIPAEEIGVAPPAETTIGPGSDDAGAAGTSYANPAYDYRLVWDPSWVVVEAPNNDLGLSNGTSFVAFLGAPFAGDPTTCVQEVASEITNTLPGATLADQGGTVERPFAAYFYDDETIGPAYYRVECRTLVPGEAMLVMSWITSRASVEDQRPVVEDLLRWLLLPPSAETAAPAEPTAPENPAASTSSTDGAFTDSYVNPTYGYSLAWGPRWQVLPGAGPDDLELSDGTSRVSVMPYPDADARSCVDAAANIKEFQYSDLAPMTDDQGVPLRGGDESLAWAALTGQDFDGTERALFFECRSLAPEAASVLFQQDAPLAAYQDAAAAFEELLASLELPG